jgi:hypothetical protein
MNTLTKLILFLSMIFAAAVLSAESKPNFTGTWKLNLAKSDMGGAPVEALTVEVDHHDPVFKYTAKGSASGQAFEETESLTTDGKPGQDSKGATVTTRWEGESLVSEAIGGDGNVMYVTRLSMSEDGKTVKRVFERKSADDPQTRRETYDKQ